MNTQITASPKLYIGIDIHKRSWKVHCATDLFCGKSFSMPPEAAWQSLRADPVMQTYYRKHQGKNVKSVIIKVARKLLSRTLAVIKTEIPYTIGIIE